MKKRLVSLFLIFALAVGLLPALAVPASAADGGYCGENAQWTLDDQGVLRITGTGSMFDFYKGSEEECWQPLLDKITSVVVGEGVSNVGAGAFLGAPNLKEVFLSETVETIGEAAFKDCRALECVWCPARMTSIGEAAFKDCWALTTVMMPTEGLTAIKKETFSGCFKLKNFTIPETVTSIGKKAFSSCAFESVVIPEGVTYVPEEAFSFCKLKSVELPGTLKTIENAAFYGCRNLTQVEIPAGVEGMYYAAFGYCAALESVTFLGDLPYIEDAFAGLRNGEPTTTTVYYPNGNVTYTANSMQDYGGSLTWVPYGDAPENPFTDVKEGKWYSEAVAWAVGSGITTGTSGTTFSPDASCTRAQVVTFLWRAAGCPEPESIENPFTDVKEGKSYTDAVLWAVYNGITTGMSETAFGTHEPCTRAQVVTFLWRAAGCPTPESAENPFTDVKEGKSYTNAVLWAVENGITTGTSETTFAPQSTCTRAHVVTFLYRAVG